MRKIFGWYHKKDFSPLRVFTSVFIIVWLLSIAWSLATPLFGGPDEPAQVIKAAAVARGEFTGKLVGKSNSPFGQVLIPEYYATTRNIPACFHRDPKQPASCAPLPYGSKTPTYAFTYVDRYPPLYYFLVGLPSLLGDHRLELYLMRFLSGFLASLFIATAVVTAVRYSRFPLVILGVILGATPLLMFLTGVVNPAGLEAAAALSTWTSGIIIVKEYFSNPPKSLVLILAVSSITFEMVRGLSPFWLFLTGIILFLANSYHQMLQLLKSRHVQIAIGSIFIFAVVAVAWIFKYHTLNLYSRSKVSYTVKEGTILEIAFGRSMQFIHQIVGIFGWSGTDSPFASYFIYIGLISILVILAFILGEKNDIYALSVLIFALLAVPTILSASQVHKIGFVWSGRDSLPLALGIPVMAAETIAMNYKKLFTAEQIGKFLGFSVLLVALVRFVSYTESLRRNAVGTMGPDFDFLFHASFNPPLGNLALLLFEFVLLITFIYLIHIFITHYITKNNCMNKQLTTEKAQGRVRG